MTTILSQAFIASVYAKWRRCEGWNALLACELGTSLKRGFERSRFSESVGFVIAIVSGRVPDRFCLVWVQRGKHWISDPTPVPSTPRFADMMPIKAVLQVCNMEELFPSVGASATKAAFTLSTAAFSRNCRFRSRSSIRVS